MSVERRRENAVEVITINRPEKRNALDPQTIDGIGDALMAAETDAEVRVVVITGAGDRAFCAGMDLGTVGGPKREPTPGSERYQRFVSTPFLKPTIAAANGSAVAGGFELLMACDLVVASEHATFGIPEVKRGLIPGAGGTLLPLRLPIAIAVELALTGELISATRAYELGLVNRVVPPDRVLSEALALAGMIAENSPNAVRVTKRLLYETREMTAAQCWDGIRTALPPVLTSADAREGARAFLEHRAPIWST